MSILWEIVGRKYVKVYSLGFTHHKNEDFSLKIFRNYT
jgi:hypothetical protein